MSIARSGSSPADADLKVGTTSTADTDRKYLLERVDEAAVVQLYADGFEALSIDQRLLVWHLYQAAIAGRDVKISYPQDLTKQMLEYSGATRHSREQLRVGR